MIDECTGARASIAFSSTTRQVSTTKSHLPLPTKTPLRRTSTYFSLSNGIPRALSSTSSARWYTDSRNPGPNALCTAIAAPMTSRARRSVRESGSIIPSIEKVQQVTIEKTNRSNPSLNHRLALLAILAPWRSSFKQALAQNSLAPEIHPLLRHILHLVFDAQHQFVSPFLKSDIPHEI